MTQRDDPARRVAATYPFRFELRAAFSDMDALRHLNNGAIGRYFEEGRASLNMEAFGRGVLLDPQAGALLLFASVTIDYLLQAYYPGRVEIGCGIGRIGRSSYMIAQAAFQEGRCFALAESVLVKTQDGTGAALAETERAALRSRAIAGARLA